MTIQSWITALPLILCEFRLTPWWYQAYVFALLTIFTVGMVLWVIGKVQSAKSRR